MKITIIRGAKGSEVVIKDNNGIKIHQYVFNTYTEARIFCNGFQCGIRIAVDTLFSIPQNYETIDA